MESFSDKKKYDKIMYNKMNKTFLYGRRLCLRQRLRPGTNDKNHGFDNINEFNNDCNIAKSLITKTRTRDEQKNLEFLFTKEEFTYLNSLSSKDLNIVFDNFYSIMIDYMEKIRNKKKDVNSEILLRQDSVTAHRLFSVNKLHENKGFICDIINEYFEKNKHFKKSKIHVTVNKGTEHQDIVFYISANNREIKHLTFHTKSSKNWRGSTHFRNSIWIDTDYDKFSSGVYFTSNRVLLDKKTNIFKLEEPTDYIECTIIKLLNENSSLILFDSISRPPPVTLDINNSEQFPDLKKQSPDLKKQSHYKYLKYKNKYLKYKNKYLELKKIYNN